VTSRQLIRPKSHSERDHNSTSFLSRSKALGNGTEMDIQEAQEHLMIALDRLSAEFQKIPGSAILLRYVRSSYQNDPIRSAVELVLILFAIRYLLAPKYSTKPNYVTLSEEVRFHQVVQIIWVMADSWPNGCDQEIDELVEDWTPDPLVGKVTSFEEAEIEKRAVLVG
jgi:serine palmitoyltransferase